MALVNLKASPADAGGASVFAGPVMYNRESYSIIRHSKQQRALFLILFGAVIGVLMYMFRYYYWPLLTALILYAALRPLYDWILKFLKKPALASSVIIVILVGVVLFPLLFLVLTLTDQAYLLYQSVEQKIHMGVLDEIRKSGVFTRIIAYFGINEADIIRKITESLQKTSVGIVTGITAILSYPLALVIKFFLMILILFFLFKDGSRFASAFYRFMPFPEDIERDIIDKVNSVVKVLVAGNLLIMALQGLMVGVGLAFFGFRMALLWGCVSAILSLIPVVGTTFVWVPAAFFLAVKGDYMGALFLGLWCLFWYFILENLVKPLILGDRLNFHPLLFFFLLLGSIQTFGLPGVIVGPILLTLFYSLWEIYILIDEYNIRAECQNGSEADNGSDEEEL